MDYGPAMLALYVALAVPGGRRDRRRAGAPGPAGAAAHPEAQDSTGLPADFGRALLLFGAGGLLMAAVHPVSSASC